MSDTKNSRTRAGSVTIRAIGKTVGVAADRARALQVARDRRVLAAQEQASTMVKEAARGGQRRIAGAAKAADRAVAAARMRGNQAVGVANAELRTARGMHSGASMGLGEARRSVNEAMKPVRDMAREARRDVLRRNPRFNYQANRPYTPAELENIRSGGRWRRVFETNELYRRANISREFADIARMQREAEGAIQSAANLRAAEELAATSRQRVLDATVGVRDARIAREAAVDAAKAAKTEAIRMNARAARETMRNATRLGQQTVREAATVKGALNRGLVTVADTMRAAKRSVGSGFRTAGKVLGTINPFNRPGATPGKHKIFGFFGRMADKALGAGPRMVESLGKKVFTDTTLPGKFMRGVTKATGGAAGFAISSWIDAGVQAYDFFTDPTVSLKDVGKSTVDTVEGHQVVRKNPGWWDTTLGSSTYWNEVLKGGARVVTFGLAGNGEAGQGLFESDQEYVARQRAGSDVQEARWLKGYDVQTGNPLVDRNTGEDISAEVARIRQATRAQAKERMLQAQLVAAFDPSIKSSQQTKAELRQRFRGFDPDNLNADTYAAMVESLGARRRKSLEEMESNIANFDQFVASHPERQRKYFTTADAYRQWRTKAIETEYAESMGHMLANTKMAGELSDRRRDALYLGVTGRNYRDDVNAKLQGEDDEFFRAFNKEWGGMSLETRALYDVAGELREYESSEAAPKAPVVPTAPAKKKEEGE